MPKFFYCYENLDLKMLSKNIYSPIKPILPLFNTFLQYISLNSQVYPVNNMSVVLLPEDEDIMVSSTRSITRPNSIPSSTKKRTNSEDPTSPVRTPNKLICEKIVIMYDEWFKGGDPVLGRKTFWDEFFLLKANPTHLENLINHMEWERLLDVQTVLQLLFKQSAVVIHSSRSQMSEFV